MRQMLIVAILVIAVGSVAGADPSTEFRAKEQWYRCGECFVVRTDATTPCPICRTEEPPAPFTPTEWESCPVCASAYVKTMNPRGAQKCQTCGITLRQPRPRTLSENLWRRWRAVAEWRQEHLHGFLESKGFAPTSTGDVRGEDRLELSWETTVRDAVDVTTVLDVRGDTANLARGISETLDDAHRTLVGVHSAKVVWRGEALDLMLGKFTLPWGRADRINPTNPMPYDYTDLLDNERIGMVGASAKYSWGVASSCELVCFPWVTPSILPSRTSEWFLPPFDLHKRKELLRDLRNERGIGYGARFASTIASVDWSLSWFDGIETSPALRLGLPPRLVYNPYRAIGMDFETTFGGLGVRGEAVYRMHDSDHGDTSLRSILGVDYRWEGVFRDRDSVHCFLSYARDDVMREGTDIEYPYPFTNSLVGKIEYGYDEDTTVALSVVTTLASGKERLPRIHGGDSYFQPEVRRKIGGWEFKVGADILEGPTDSFFGFFGTNDRVTVGFRKEF